MVTATCPDCSHFRCRPTTPKVARVLTIEHNGIYHPERLERPALSDFRQVNERTETPS